MLVSWRALGRSTVVHSRRLALSASQPRPYAFHVGVGFMGKPEGDELRHPYISRPFPPTHPVIPFRERMLAWKKDSVSGSAGQDFFYVQEVLPKFLFELQGLSIGIADGVGGIIPSLFSQALMCYASHAASTNWPSEPHRDPLTDEDTPLLVGIELSPTDIMGRAFKVSAPLPYLSRWASTACIINLDATSGRLKAANIGDSGFYVIRGSNIVHAQPPQTHYFNCPFQLTKLPPNFSESWDTQPDHASTYTMTLRHGDIIIAYTDGLSDNVLPAEVTAYTASIMRRSQSDQQKAQYLADFLTLYARRCMYDFGRLSPFGLDWAKHYRERVASGGKVDDVTVVVVVVQEET
ncbi:hypothetical protein BS47DRAFT_1330125 [Hydnum rufescens UP504]|uniref:Protein phosphatase n=1 Tax=Hydnum rufescens UP504 TaxID=1448309 RepID=A0A9P6AVZ1_9AGAM|nr:hypothetical protein BS47DRAFT_1330125 [Hydnum rufescens UP504]